MIERRFLNPQGGALDFTLPDAFTYLTLGRDVLVSNVDITNDVVVRPLGKQLINTVSTTVTVSPGAAILFIPDGTGWRTLGLNVGAGVRAHLTHSVAQSIPSAAVTQLSFDTKRYDTGGFISGSTFVIPTLGVYMIGAAIEFAASTLGNTRILELRISGTVAIAIDQSPPILGGFNTSMTACMQYSLGAGVVVNCAAFQDTGGGLNVNSALAYSPNFWIQRMG